MTCWGRFDWARLNHLQVGRYGEYFIEMEFTLLGFDVYGTEADDKCIDLVVRRGVNQFYDVQVKTVRSDNYVFFPKRTFDLRPTLLAALVLLRQGKPPEPYLIPALAWLNLNDLLRSRDDEGKTSKPEWGVTLTGKSRPLLDEFQRMKTTTAAMRTLSSIASATASCTPGIEARIRRTVCSA
jgi:hypothetical protein